jgi:hypothetical protein
MFDFSGRSVSLDSALSTISVSFNDLSSPLIHLLSKSESMVEIRRVDTKPATSLSDEDQKYRLLYSKSKVYVNPTAYARDNIAGFVALVKRVRFVTNHTGSITD